MCEKSSVFAVFLAPAGACFLTLGAPSPACSPESVKNSIFFAHLGPNVGKVSCFCCFSGAIPHFVPVHPPDHVIPTGSVKNTRLFSHLGPNSRKVSCFWYVSGATRRQARLGGQKHVKNTILFEKLAENVWKVSRFFIFSGRHAPAGEISMSKTRGFSHIPSTTTQKSSFSFDNIDFLWFMMVWALLPTWQARRPFWSTKNVVLNEIGEAAMLIVKGRKQLKTRVKQHFGAFWVQSRQQSL